MLQEILISSNKTWQNNTAALIEAAGSKFFAFRKLISMRVGLEQFLCYIV